MLIGEFNANENSAGVNSQTHRGVSCLQIGNMTPNRLFDFATPDVSDANCMLDLQI